MAGRILTIAEATSLQTALNLHGAQLEVDGHYGQLSHLALLRFQHDAGLPETGVPDFVTTSALGIAPIVTSLAPPAATRSNPLDNPIIRIGLGILLNQLTKGLIPMNFLTGYKTYIVGGFLIAAGAAEFFGLVIPGMTGEPLSLIATGIGLITGRIATANVAAGK